jgi:hypothetical protein
VWIWVLLAVRHALPGHIRRQKALVAIDFGVAGGDAIGKRREARALVWRRGAVENPQDEGESDCLSGHGDESSGYQRRKADQSPEGDSKICAQT